MSARRFIGYFIALSACSTLAFASSLLGPAPAQEAEDRFATESSLLPPAYFAAHFHLRKHLPKHLQVALAE